MAATVDIMDFTESEEPIQFKIGDDVFQCAPDVPLGIYQQITKFRNMGDNLAEKGADAFLDIFKLFMFDESYARFAARVYSKEHPIGLKHIMKIFPWLLEQYGLRPTQPSSSSFDGSSDGETGTSSTDGVLPAALTLAPSPSTDSST